MRFFSALMLVCFLVFSIPTVAFGAHDIAVNHQPPEVVLGENPVFEVVAPGMKRVRMLVVTREGYRAVPMSQSGNTFQAQISFDDMAILRYQFQLETIDGRKNISKYYSVRQPSGQEVETEILELAKKAEKLKARVTQVENAIHSLRSTDPEVLGRRRKKELAKAYILLGKRERRLDERQASVKDAYAEYEKLLRRSLKGRSVFQGRRLLMDEGGTNASW